MLEGGLITPAPRTCRLGMLPGVETDCLLAVDTPRFMGATSAKRGSIYIRNILEHSPCEVLQ